MGGLMTLLMAMMMPDRLAAVVLNDVGPLVPWSGLVRLKGHASGARTFATGMYALSGVLAALHDRERTGRGAALRRGGPDNSQRRPR